MWNCAIKTQTHAGSDADDALLKMLLKMHRVLMRLEGFFKKKKKEKQKDDEKFIFITQKWRVERGRKSQALKHCLTLYESSFQAFDGRFSDWSSFLIARTI